MNTKYLIGAMVLGVAVAWSAVAMSEETADQPSLVAVKFHADWCGSCDAMGDVFTDLQNKLDDEPVLFIELDLTTTAGQKQAGYLMQVMGGDAVWNEHGGKTGFILLLNPDDMTVVGKLDKTMTFKDMVAEIDKAQPTS